MRGPSLRVVLARRGLCPMIRDAGSSVIMAEMVRELRK